MSLFYERSMGHRSLDREADMRSLKIWTVWIGMILAACIFGGCADEVDMDGYPISMAATWEDWFLELAGSWEGIGDTEGTRYDIYDDGKYDFYVKNGGEWRLQYSGEIWIEYGYSRGLYRTTIHISMPDNDDYAVHYHIVDGVLHFEEPSDTEPTMRYKSVGSRQ